MEGFDLTLVAIDVYDHHESLPSTRTAERIAQLLEPYGVASVNEAERTGEASALVEFLETWATTTDGPGSSLLYWVGHGSREGQYSWLLAGQSRSPLTEARAVNARVLADMVRTRWIERAASESAWTVIVLDVCRGRDAATALVHALTSDPGGRPGQLAIVEVGGNAATEVGRFADALEEALAGFTEHDEVIPLRSLLFAATDRLGGRVEPTIWLGREAAIANPLATRASLMTGQDLVEEWRAVIADLEPDAREHFLAKAQGTELGELGWLFEGRVEECRQVAGWLRDTSSGMLVVTGEPGAGKSALLGRFVALAEAGVVDVLERTGLLTDAPELRPEPGAFDGVIHLAGRTLHDARSALAEAVPELLEDNAHVPASGADRPVTLLVDALDEAQSPQAIAYDLLQPLARQPNVRVVVGTRRSLAEGPDLPDAQRAELLDALGVAGHDAIVLGREPEAMARYARHRLEREAPDLNPALLDHIVERIAGLAQPFLFVKMALHELVARVADLDREVVDAILSGSHGHVFGLAVERLATERPATVQLLRALAYTQGRGLPRHDGVWSEVARALHPGAAFRERDIEQALTDAARYVVLDGEYGHSVHRLAHRTFAERFLNDDPDLVASHAAITDQLLANAADGWGEANPYVLAHLPRHAATSPERLERICIDPTWLAATLRRLGIDELLSILDATPATSRTDPVAMVHGAIRRARVALARDSDQLAAQLHARLHDQDDHRVRVLVDALPSIAPPVWLRIAHGGGDWSASEHPMMTFEGKIRALATGRLRGDTVILVGAADTVVAWDPSRGTVEHLFSTDGERVTALAIGAIGGRDVVAVAAAYDGTATVYPVDGGEPLLRHTGVHARSIALNFVAGAPVVATSDGHTVRFWTLEGEADRVDLDAEVLALGVEGGAFLAVLRDSEGLRVRRLDGPGGHATPGDTLLPAGADDTTHAVASIEDGSVIVFATSATVEAWDARTGRPLGRVEANPEFVVRTASAIVLDGALTLVAGNDTDYEGGYVLVRVPGLSRPSIPPDHRVAEAIAVTSDLSAAVRLDRTGVLVLDPRDGSESRGEPAVLAERFSPALPAWLPSTGWQLGPTEPVDPPATLSVERPHDWPVDARAYGRLDGQPVIATAHVDGVCWLWKATGEVIAGPFGNRDRRVKLPHSNPKQGPQRSVDVAYVEGPAGAVVARVHDGDVSAWDVRSGVSIEVTDLPGSEATAVALGVVQDEVVLARGAAGGAVSLWSMADRGRLCGLAFDAGIRRLWFDPHTPRLVALTTDGRLHSAEVVTAVAEH